MTNQQSAKLPEPSVGPLHDPVALVAAEFASIFVPPLFVVLLFLRYGAISSMPRFRRRWRSGSESYQASAITRSGFCCGRPRVCGTETVASVASASVTSAGEALSSRTPSGILSPSASTTSFPCRAWFCRPQRPFFGRRETAVQKTLVPTL
jgi:hypothetical protein